MRPSHPHWTHYRLCQDSDIVVGQHESYSSGSEPSCPCSDQAHRDALSFHLRTCPGWGCQPATHQHKPTDGRHLHEGPCHRQVAAVHDKPRSFDR